MPEEKVIPQTIPEMIAYREEALTHYDKSSIVSFRIKEMIAQLENLNKPFINIDDIVI